MRISAIHWFDKNVHKWIMILVHSGKRRYFKGKHKQIRNILTNFKDAPNKVPEKIQNHVYSQRQTGWRQRAMNTICRQITDQVRQYSVHFRSLTRLQQDYRLIRSWNTAHPPQRVTGQRSPSATHHCTAGKIVAFFGTNVVLPSRHPVRRDTRCVEFIPFVYSEVI